MRKRTTAPSLRLIVLVSLVAGLNLQSDYVISANTACVQSICIALPFISVPQPLTVSGQYGFRDRMGITHLQGQIINQSNFPIANAQIRISGASDLGEIVSQTVPLAFPVSLPGQINPFEWRLTSNGPLNPQFESIGGSITNTQTVSLTIVSSRALSANIFEITFRNDRSVPLKNVQAVFGVVYTFRGYIQYETANMPRNVTNYLTPGMTVTQTFFVESMPYILERWVVAAQGTLDP